MKTPRDQKHASNRPVPPVVLPEGYDGKILLVAVFADALEKTVILRSGDIWHREILRNTEKEIRGLGLRGARVHQLGGALTRCEPNGNITIYGTSQQFGTCDKEYAAELLRAAFPGRKVEVQD